MKIEILFSKLCNQFGDSKNILYLQKSAPDAEFFMTEITDSAPHFAEEDVDLLYMGSMNEKAQKRVVDFLSPYKARIEELVEKGKVFLMTGNAMEIFTKRIENLTEKTSFDGLGLFDLTTKIDLFARFNGKVLGKVEDMEIVGFKSQFSMVYGDNTKEAFFPATRGIGINKESKFEGIRRKNFFGTHILGPILVLNPLFTEYLLRLAGAKEPKAAFREEALAAYEVRLKEFHDPKIPF